MKGKFFLVILLLCVALILTGCGCKHEHTELVNQREATCTEDGYTGDVYCRDCQKTTQKGTTIMAGHKTSNHYAHRFLANCWRTGYTGDLLCDVCGQVAVVGEKMPIADHKPSPDRVHVRASSCSFEGYTGDICCTECGQILERGQTLPKVEHEPQEELWPVREATCSSEGYTGDLHCKNCWGIIEKGEQIPKLPHTWGEYTGRWEASCIYEGATGYRYCTVCRKYEQNQPIARLSHHWENGVCTVCSWPEPGLYQDDKLIYTWDQLVEFGYVKMKGTQFNGVHSELTGRLVISDEVSGITGRTVLKGTKLDEVYVPGVEHQLLDHWYATQHVKHFVFYGKDVIVSDSAFQACYDLESVTFINGVGLFKDAAFAGCSSIVSFAIPEGLTKIPANCFINCESLREVSIPNSVTTIEKEVFCNCTSLQEIVLPDGISAIDKGAFSKTSLKVLDLSGSTIETLSSVVKYCSSLEKIIFPTTLKTIDAAALQGCKSLQELKLPEGMTTFGYTSDSQGWNSLKKVYWPASLLEFKILGQAKNLEELYYGGDELQWSSVDHSFIDETKVAVHIGEPAWND